jgi:hypothetical protein
MSISNIVQNQNKKKTRDVVQQSNAEQLEKGFPHFLFLINFIEFLNDESAIQLLKTNKWYYATQYPRYKLKESYDLTKLCLSMNRSKHPVVRFIKDIGNDEIRMIETLNLVHVLEFSFSDSFDDTIYFENDEFSILPNTLTTLNLGENFDDNVDYWLPISLLHLKFGNYFDQKVDHLPENLLTLYLGDEFNQSIDKLPSKLTKLVFQSKNYRCTSIFNQSINLLPENLLTLHLSDAFNQSVDRLPSNLTELVFGSSFNQTVDLLPENLLMLQFSYSFNQSVDKLPSNLTILEFLGPLFEQPVNNLPVNLKELTFGEQFNQRIDKLPLGLISLTFAQGFEEQGKELILKNKEIHDYIIEHDGTPPPEFDDFDTGVVWFDDDFEGVEGDNSN